MKNTLESLPFVPTRHNSFESNHSSVISWRYSTSMSMSSSRSSTNNSMKYINIELSSENHLGVENKISKKRQKIKKNFVLANKQNLSLNKTPKLINIAPAIHHANNTILRPQNGQLSNVTLPKLRNFPYNQNNNNHAVSISSVRSQWPENKITQVEHKFRGEVDRLERTREDLTKRNTYLEKEIAKEQGLLKHSFPGRTLEHLKLRNSILIEQKYEAQKLDQDNRIEADEAEEKQISIGKEYDEMVERSNALQEKLNTARQDNDEEKSTFQQYNEKSKNLSTRLNINNNELNEKTKLLEKCKEKNEEDRGLLKKLKIRLKEVTTHCEKLQKDIQVQDADCLSLFESLNELNLTKDRIVQAVNIVTLDLEKAKEVLKSSQDGASKLEKDVNELQIIIDEKEEKLKQKEIIKINSKDVEIQTREKLTHMRNIAWIRIAEEETIFSPYIKYISDRDKEREVIPIIEIVDNKVMRNSISDNSMFMTSQWFDSRTEI